jgi:hypothetical protein
MTSKAIKILKYLPPAMYQQKPQKSKSKPKSLNKPFQTHILTAKIQVTKKLLKLMKRKMDTVP